jgi:hypothetical protein
MAQLSKTMLLGGAAALGVFFLAIGVSEITASYLGHSWAAYVTGMTFGGAGLTILIGVITAIVCNKLLTLASKREIDVFGRKIKKDQRKQNNPADPWSHASGGNRWIKDGWL